MKTSSLIRRSLVVSLSLGFGLAFVPELGHAASTGDLDLTGTVAAACDVDITPVAGVADNLNLGAAAANLLVAAVRETCNDPDGYTLTAQSANSSVLSPLGTSADSVPYTFAFNGSSADLSGGAPVTVTNVIAPTGAAGVSKNVNISYANPGYIAADTYADTITFTIAAK